MFDADRHVIFPRLINLYHYFYQTLTRAYPQALNNKLFPCLKTLYPLWTVMISEAMHVGTPLAQAELLLSRCTTVSDHHCIFPTGLEQAIDLKVEESKNLGIRDLFCRGTLYLSQKDGSLPFDAVVQSPDMIFIRQRTVVTEIS